MLTDAERNRLGELRSRVDLTPEEQQEQRELWDRFRQKSDADFDVSWDLSGNAMLIPNSDAAKQEMPNNLTAHDRTTLDRAIEDLRRRGYSVQRKAG